MSRLYVILVPSVCLSWIHRVTPSLHQYLECLYFIHLYTRQSILGSFSFSMKVCARNIKIMNSKLLELLILRLHSTVLYTYYLDFNLKLLQSA